jgi:hypothetical protein
MAGCRKRKATKPYNQKAIREANEAVPECRTAGDRRRWMDAYIEAGGKWECADPKGKPPGEVVKSCKSTLRVEVLDELAGTAIKKADVRVSGLGNKSADDVGVASWTNVPPDFYEIQATKDGYTTATDSVMVPASSLKHTLLKLQRTCPVTHVFVLFEGWNAPWESEGGKPIPLSRKSTVNTIRKNAISTFNTLKAGDPKMQQHRFASQAYATDTDDDVKTLAIAFIKANLKNRGKVIIYGYSWGGDTAVELAKDLKDEKINVDLLITIDAALGPFNGPAVRDREIPENVKLCINHYTTTPKSRVQSQGLPFWAKDSKKTTVRNIKHTGPTHGEMDETTAKSVNSYVKKELGIHRRYCDG